MIHNILHNYLFWVSMIIFVIGIFMLALDRNLIKKIIGLNIMDTAAYLFLGSLGYIQGLSAPIFTGKTMGQTGSELFINPIPSALVLTGIVVSVSVTALLLALTVRLYKKYNTLNLDEIIEAAGKEEDDD
ncbi:MAG: cation:proton antiporter subunit C [Oscillospiraceae bacterium]|nr:cation:proton antiporter subunit C [Oscillospiraceae bacterium]